ncbi:4-hydroxyphenylacetate 3-hydroxylase N-terminal domain-containing protein [Nguyenibacter sp. L1]|uniref:4-hydroxyphenylacetate 3-hydroxylase family protein n=1 Tax=Nguyenibacter sp. L1 TaxID=3049350 RepID=UPI002B46347B|nr:4-hydroxyphenylacetate 3-hydroxylase N-terminal domain-containing protein [Nguyenibacter sp. L1]WRH88842.1 4-hydroxyphenylacetate 3-hydroxylase N-terminal domain-containing protein [Nguyenibacter sp. L1]
MKTGEQHRESLRDGRAVYINGGRVPDVTVHPAFRRSIDTVCALYDIASDEQNRDLMTCKNEAGVTINRIWQLPHTHSDLVKRREALEFWSMQHAGFFGRSPDHVASCISGLYMGRDIFEAADPARAAALVDYYRYASESDLFLTYVIINPQGDVRNPGDPPSTRRIAASVVDQGPSGIVIDGAKMLASGGVMANEVFVTCIQPLAPGEEALAFSAVLPMNTPGLRILSRKSYEEGASSVFDNPMASRFDENDAILVFENVTVPWERVFVHNDRDLCAKQFFATPAHVYQNYQAMIRLKTKLTFLVGIARKIAQVNGTERFPSVRETLGQLAADVGMLDAMVAGMEAKGTSYGSYFIPDHHSLYSAQTITQKLYPRFIEQLRDLAGGGVIMLPSSSKDMENPEMMEWIRKTQASPVLDAADRVKFFKLAWDCIGSEFASRHTQYEMFYAGASFVPKNHSFRTFDWDRSTTLVDQMLSSY